MWSLLVITCIIFQTAVAVFLLNGVRRDDDIDKHLRAMLIILLLHLSTKFFLLAVLQDVFLYAVIPTGFGLAYGPLLLVIARGVLNSPLRPRAIFWQFFPFLLFSLVYVVLVTAGVSGSIGRPVIAGYASWYGGLVIASLVCYPVYVKILLRGGRANEAREKMQLTSQMANVLLVGIGTGILLSLLHFSAVHWPGFDLRLLPYICFSAIPVLILRYRLRERRAAPELELSAAVPGVAQGAGVVVAGTGPGVETMRVAAAPEVIAVDRRYERSGMDAGMMNEYEAALAAFMQKSRIYLDPDLSLELLATRMKMSRHHLTQLLNEKLEKNFYSFINEYRIGEAIDRLNDPTLQVNILSLAFDCGFNSKSSFNNYFKKITGSTPTAYRKERVDRSAPGGGEDRPGRSSATEKRKPLLIPDTSSSI
jgi:AraC-like DNA-binding protein